MERPVRYQASSLRDPCRRAYFQDLVRGFSMQPYIDGSPSCRTAIDNIAEEFAAYCKWAASQAFVEEKTAPRKAWISDVTWNVMRDASNARAYLRRCHQQRRQ
eukprot:7344368-Karenia_brevis.AAC.1